VQTLQNKLISLGYLSGSADGKFGSSTRRAVKAFQQANGLIAVNRRQIHIPDVQRLACYG